MKQYKFTIISMLIGFIALTASNYAYNYTKEIKSMDRGWRYSIGLNEQWLKTDFDDSRWDKTNGFESIYSENLSGYTGFLVARKSVKISSKHKGAALGIKLYNANSHQVYFNGQYIGSSGEFPPKNDNNSSNLNVSYIIPNELIRWDEENVIACKSYINKRYNKVVASRISFIKKPPYLEMDVSLAGEWKFELGDSLIYAQEDFDDAYWPDVKVPMFWAEMGYKDYDGFAWYRRSFTNNTIGKDDYIMLFVGKICDIDQVYINGKLVASSGDFESLKRTDSNLHNEQRKYLIPANLLKDGENTIAIRVYDFEKDGGIYSGTMGIVTQTKYINYWNAIRDL